jgi:transposase InsO family protein
VAGHDVAVRAAARTPAEPAPVGWLAQARVVITDWKDDYNQRRRHSSLGYQADERLSHEWISFRGPATGSWYAPRQNRAFQSEHKALLGHPLVRLSGP